MQCKSMRRLTDKLLGMRRGVLLLLLAVFLLSSTFGEFIPEMNAKKHKTPIYKFHAISSTRDDNIFCDGTNYLGMQSTS